MTVDLKGVIFRALFVIGCIGAILYFATYLHLRQRGLREMQITNIEAIFYVSVHDLENNDHALKTHQLRVNFFSPINYIDRKCFGGKGPPLCILTDLS